MEMRSVTSSNISAIGYAADHQMLAVTFAHSGTYVFASVPSEINDEFRKLEASGGSVGKFFAANVKGRFPSTKFDGVPTNSDLDAIVADMRRRIEQEAQGIEFAAAAA